MCYRECRSWVQICAIRTHYKERRVRNRPSSYVVSVEFTERNVIINEKNWTNSDKKEKLRKTLFKKKRIATSAKSIFLFRILLIVKFLFINNAFLRPKNVRNVIIHNGFKIVYHSFFALAPAHTILRFFRSSVASLSYLALYKVKWAEKENASPLLPE